MKLRMTLVGTALFTFSLFAQATLINFDGFDGLAITDPLDNFYAADGVIFQAGDWLVNTGFGQTSQPNLAFSVSGTGYMNVLGGFTNSLNFSYGAFVDSTVNIFDGLNGTGSNLGSLNLLANDASGAFDFVSIVFSGTARSVAIVSDSAMFGWDDVQFTNNPSAVPIPASFPLLALGLAALGYSRRKQKRYA